MRRDMKRVLIGRPRTETSEDHFPRHRYVRCDDDGAPERESMRRAHADRKFTTDHLGPLRRFLRSRVGRRWDAVWSEVCAVADARSLDGWHLREHVRMEVRGAGGPTWWFRRHGLYVDSAGFLRLRRARRCRRAPAPDPNLRQVDTELCYARLDGSWFALERGPRIELRRWNAREGRHETFLCAEDDPRRWRKRQLGKRELRRLGLVNQPRHSPR